jgi:hypothetical protein
MKTIARNIQLDNGLHSKFEGLKLDGNRAHGSDCCRRQHSATYACFTKPAVTVANCHSSSSERGQCAHAPTAAPPSSTPCDEEGGTEHVSTSEGTRVCFVLASGIFHCSADTSGRAAGNPKNALMIFATFPNRCQCCAVTPLDMFRDQETVLSFPCCCCSPCNEVLGYKFVKSTFTFPGGHNNYLSKLVSPKTETRSF